jgi:hypothetical protein
VKNHVVYFVNFGDSQIYQQQSVISTFCTLLLPSARLQKWKLETAASLKRLQNINYRDRVYGRVQVTFSHVKLTT